MGIRRRLRWTLAAALALSPVGANAVHAKAQWSEATMQALAKADLDFARHANEPDLFAGFAISQTRLSENGFTWHLILLENQAMPEGPLWVVPHDDEAGAFESMLWALRTFGGTAIVVNSTGELRMQSGRGRCGVRPGTVSQCDPNRNFARTSPLYVSAFLDQYHHDWPVIAFHANQPGFAGDNRGGAGNISLLDRAAYRRGRIAPMPWASLATGPAAEMDNYDTFGLVPFLRRNGRPSDRDAACGRALASAGIGFWHEPVGESDGSLSNYLTLYYPETRYFNAEARMEGDPARVSARHTRMVGAYMQQCVRQADPGTAPSTP